MPPLRIRFQPVVMPAAPRRIFDHILLLTLIAVLPMTALLGFTLVQGYREERARMVADLQALGDNGARHIATFLASTTQLFQRLAEAPELQVPDVAARDAFLGDFGRRHPEFVNALLADRDGFVRAAARYRGRYPDASLFGEPTLKALMTAPGLHLLSNAVHGRLSRRWTCWLVVPLTTPAGERTGTFVVPLDLAHLSPSLLDVAGPRDERLTVLDGEGRIILATHDPEHEIGRVVPQFERLSAGGATSTVRRFPGLDGEPVSAVAQAIPGTPWLLVSHLPSRVVLDEPLARLVRNLVLAAGGLALLVFLVRRQAGAIADPLLALAGTARAIGSGRTDLRASEEGPAEIADLAHSFNAMLAAQAEAGRALRESQQQLELALNGADLGLWDWRVDSAAIDVNESWTRMLGYEPGELNPVYSLWESMIHPDDRETVLARLQDHLDGRTDLYEAEYRMRAKSGDWVWILDRGRVVERDAAGQPRRAAGTHLNITARKRAEAEQAALARKLLETQKLESLGLLAGGIAHDFNNLLTGVLGNASLARYELPPDSAATGPLTQIEQTAMRAAELCQQMLAYSGKGRFHIQPVDLNDLIRDTTGLLEISIGKRAALRLELAAALPPVEADATQLRQVVMNLVINAAEAMEDRYGQITLVTALLAASADYLATLQAGAEVGPGDYVVLEVSDTGCGMAKDTIAHIFDPFYTTKFTGRGLGLAAVLGIIRGHRGALKVYSELGRGTTFRILLPAGSGASARLAEAGVPAGGWRGAGRILVIDDEETVRTVLARSLHTLGFAAEAAADGESGIACFRRDPAAFAAVILDLTMPGLDGEAVYRELRVIQPGVKVILTSGFNHQEAVNRFVGKDLAGFVQKPFTFEQLATALRRALEMPRDLG